MWNQDLMDAVQFPTGGELLSIRLAHSELGGNERKKTIAASVVSFSLFVILGSAAFGFWRYRVKHNAMKSKVASLGEWRNDLKPEDVSRLNFFEMNFQPIKQTRTRWIWFSLQGLRILIPLVQSVSGKAASNEGSDEHTANAFVPSHLGSEFENKIRQNVFVQL